MERSGILLLAHGARDPQWARPFEAVLQRLQLQALAWETTFQSEAPPVMALAYLEFMSPDCMGAGRDLIDHGCTRVTVVPLFLGAGGHVRKDLPELIGTLQQQHPQVTWTLSPAVGETDILIQALAESAWVLAGHSRDTFNAPTRPVP